MVPEDENYNLLNYSFPLDCTFKASPGVLIGSHSKFYLGCLSSGRRFTGYTQITFHISFIHWPAVVSDGGWSTSQSVGANVVRAHEQFPCGGRRSGH